MLYFTGSLVIILCLISCFISSAAPLPSESPISIVSKDHLLQKSPALVKSDHRPYGTVGVLFYAYRDGIPYVLLARESGGTDKGTYCEFGGSLELNADGTPETFQEGCIRECVEESAGLYKPSRTELLQSKVYFEKTSKGREVVLCLVKTTKFHQSADLFAAQRQFKDDHFKEKDALLWVKADDLLAGKAFDPENKTFITLRPFFKELLEKPSFKKLLEEII
jgi:hypothetical protein